jgi:ribonucleoside-diphosphate reductase alpha chain
MFKYDDVYKSSLDYFDGDELAAGVFAGKYALSDRDGFFYEKNPNDMHIRLAKEFARIEMLYPNPMTYEEIYDLFKDFKYVIPQGSPMSAIGNSHQIQSTSNCFVIESPYDSYGGILKTDQELVQIAKRRGGVGFDLSKIRPKGLSTGNAARTTDGIEVFMDRFSNSCREVAQGGRRGALMLTISVHHPQIKDFIKIKRNLERVTGANISIRVSDKFMKSVRDDKEFETMWPVNSKNPEIVKKLNAREVWGEIIDNAYTSAEPGVLFWDTATSMTPSDIYAEEGFSSISTNPCGEIILSSYDSCRLMIVNLASFVENKFTNSSFFDFDKFADVVRKAQRLMDDMIDIEVEQIDKIISKVRNDPEPTAVKRIELDLWKNVKEQAVAGRRTGLGITGLGDALAYMGIKYGSENSIKMTEKIYKNLSLNAYRSSCEMARERGSFPIHDPHRERNHPFLSQIWAEDPELWDMNVRWGRRNISLTTTAPAGSVSTMTQTTSGIEPSFLLSYTRRKKISNVNEDGRVDFIDSVGDMWQEYEVYHHGFKMWMDTLDASEYETMSNEKLVDISPYAGSTANEIDWVAKVKMQAAAQKWVCHAISNTTNLPKDVDIETVKNVYMTGWELGCKGITVYRDGSRSGVLIRNDDKSQDRELGFKSNTAPKRPEELNCDIHQATISGEPWTIIIGLMEGRPYEIFGGKSEYVEIPKKYKSGVLIKRPRKSMNSKYDLRFGENGDEVVIKDISTVFDNPNHSAFTRTLSLALRHGAPVHYVCEQLQKDKEQELFSFSRVIARCLKKYIADGTKVSNGNIDCNCESKDLCNIVYQEGCATCLSCGYAKCG